MASIGELRFDETRGAFIELTALGRGTLLAAVQHGAVEIIYKGLTPAHVERLARVAVCAGTERPR